MKVFDRPFFRKAWWRVNVVVLASASDATLMLDFCEVQHPKLNRRAALGRLRRGETIPNGIFGSFCASLLKKNGEKFLSVPLLRQFHKNQLHKPRVD
ncbi:MAG: hypothetical protein J6S28_08045 [Clostridia bacterium]|nr:hypothetical protein [Clostridia bacterium]